MKKRDRNKIFITGSCTSLARGSKLPLNMKNILAAVKEAKSKSTKRKFSQSIVLAINLQNIDMKKPEGRIQERIELPNLVGKERRVCVVASGEPHSEWFV